MKQNEINKFHNLDFVIVVHNTNSLGQDIVPRLTNYVIRCFYPKTLL